MHTVYLALGSNVSPREQYLQTAIEKLGKRISQIFVAKQYETEPMYYEKQGMFLNSVLRGKTDLPPHDLLRFAKQIEKEIGRVERFRNGPREIDIDILFYDDLIFKNGTLEIPHPRIAERAFVLRPFIDIDPEFMHPVLRKTIKELYEDNIH